MIRIAVSTQLWGEQQLGDEQFEAIAESGFRELELFAAPGHFEWEDRGYVDKIAAIVRSLGLRVFSIHAPWAPGQDIACLDDSRRKSSIDSVLACVDDLAFFGANVLVLHPGATLEDSAKKGQLMDNARESIRLIADYCGERGVRIALENPPPYELGGENGDLLDLYRHFADEPVVQACFDTGHANLSPDGMAFVDDVPKEILMVHVSDNGGAADDHWAPSPEGTVPWDDLLSRLRKRDFEGCLMLELTDLPDRSSVLSLGYEWMTAALQRLS